MENPTSYVLLEIQNNIPRQILNLAFPSNRMETIDTTIRREIIERVVLPKCHWNVGKRIQIPLLNDYKESIPDGVAGNLPWGSGNNVVYRIPPEARENKSITDVICLEYPKMNEYSGAYFGDYCGNFTGMTAGGQARRALNGVTYMDEELAPTPRLLDGDLLMVDPPSDQPMEWVAICMIPFDKNFSGINREAVPALAKLAVALTKRHIYTHNRLDVGYMDSTSGASHSDIKSEIESYSDYNDEMINELIQELRGGIIMSDEDFGDYLYNMF